MKAWISKTLVVVACALGASGAAAAPCVGFADVDDTAPPTGDFCPSVEWIKNRVITTGCGDGSNYCPNLFVDRLAMAAFMQRLGKALTPEVHVDHVTRNAATIPGEPPEPVLFMCEMAGDSTVVAYPRKALLHATVTGLADANPVAWRAFWLYSTNSGATFQPIVDGPDNISTPRASSAANQWSGVALAFALDVPANTPLQVRVGVRRDNVLTGTTGDFVNARCQMTVSIVNANGATSPL